MTPATQPNLIDNLMNGYSCIFYPMCHIARELSYCPKKVGKRDCEDYRSRLTPSPDNILHVTPDGAIWFDETKPELMKRLILKGVEVQMSIKGSPLRTEAPK